jgi:hypothetical protein
MCHTLYTIPMAGGESPAAQTYAWICRARAPCELNIRQFGSTDQTCRSRLGGTSDRDAARSKKIQHGTSTGSRHELPRTALDHWLPAWDLGTTAGVTEALGHKQSFSPLVPHRWQNHALLDRERNPQCILIADGQRPASVIRLSQQCIKSAARTWRSRSSSIAAGPPRYACPRSINGWQALPDPPACPGDEGILWIGRDGSNPITPDNGSAPRTPDNRSGASLSTTFVICVCAEGSRRGTPAGAIPCAFSACSTAVPPPDEFSEI